MTKDRSGRKASPDAAADVSKGLSATPDARYFNRPRCRASIEASFAEPLQYAAAVRTDKAHREQVDSAGQRAAEEARKKRYLAAAPVGKGT